MADIEPKVAVTKPVVAIVPFIDTIPSNWDIQRSEEDSEVIYAVSGMTGETFNGQISEFNRLLKGE